MLALLVLCPSATHAGKARSPARFTVGFRSAFGPGYAVVDGAPNRRRVSLRRPLSVSHLVANLHRLEVPPIREPNDVERLIDALAIQRDGTIASRLRRIAATTHRIGGGAIVRLSEHPSAKPLEPDGYGYLEGHNRQGAIDMITVRGLPAEVTTRYVLGELFARATDRRGRISIDRLRAPRAEIAALLRGLGRLPHRPAVKQDHDAPLDSEFLTSHLAPRLLRAVVREYDAAKPKRLPLLELVDRLYPYEYGYKTHVLFRGHMLLTNQTLADHLGKRRTAVGKNYSTPASVVVQQRRTPWFGEQRNLEMWAIEPSEVIPSPSGRPLSTEVAGRVTKHLQEEVVDAMRSVGHLDGEHFQVIDEGAEALLYLNRLAGDPQAPEHAPSRPRGYFAGDVKPWYGFGSFEAWRAALSGVEGTRDGSRKLAGIDLQYAVVDYGEAPVKLHMVSPFIGWSVAEESHRIGHDMARQGYRRPKRVLVGGYGSTGRAVALILQAMGYQVTVKEGKEGDRFAQLKNRELAVAELGAARVISEVPEDNDFDLVIGCVGGPWLTNVELKRFKSGTLLASATSANKEFSFRRADGWQALNLRNAASYGGRAIFQGRVLQLGTLGTDMTHWHIPIRNGEQQLLLLNGVYPVNMTGAPDPIQARYAQLIRALTLFASRQARALAGQPGRFPLEARGQRLIAEEFMRLLDQGQPLPPIVRTLVEQGYRAALAELGE